MKTVSANFSGILSALGPIFGAWLAVLILGEQISALSWLGIVLVVAATLAAVFVPKWFMLKKVLTNAVLPILASFIIGAILISE